MDKKLKMWIAVGVVVIVVVGTILYNYWQINQDTPIIDYEVQIKVSEKETNWVINVTDITKIKTKHGLLWDSKERTKDVKVGSGSFELVVYGMENIEINFHNYEYKMDTIEEEYGVTWLDVGDTRYLNKGDSFILYKEGGTEFNPAKGNTVFIRTADGIGGVYVYSNRVKLP
ncbi:MAG: hypothetical protein R6U61_04985 [Thermoplasmata archaeon]